MLLISVSVTCLVGTLRFFLPAATKPGKSQSFRFYWPRAGFIRVYLIYELIGYCGYFLAYSMLNLICKSRFGLDDSMTGLVSGLMTLVSGTAIFIIPVFSGKFGRAKMNLALILSLAFLYTIMAFTGGPAFLILAVITAAMQCMMGGLIDGPMLGRIPEQERGGFSGLKLLLQNTGTGSGIFLAGVMLNDGKSLSFLYLMVCMLIILQLVLFLSGVMKQVKD